MKKLDVKLVAYMSVVAALYVALTFAFAPLSYGAIQFRISEILVLLVLYRKEYRLPLVIGCLVANLLSPIGFVDIIFGTFATFIVVMLMPMFNNKVVASLIPAIFNGIIIGLELFYVYEAPLLLSVIQVFIGEFVVVTLIGLAVFKALEEKEVLKYILNIQYDPVRNKNSFLYFSYANIVLLVILFFTTPINYDADNKYIYLSTLVSSDNLKYIVVLILPSITLFFQFLENKNSFLINTIIVLISITFYIVFLVNAHVFIWWSLLYFLPLLLIELISIYRLKEKAY